MQETDKAMLAAYHANFEYILGRERARSLIRRPSAGKATQTSSAAKDLAKERALAGETPQDTSFSTR